MTLLELVPCPFCHDKEAAIDEISPGVNVGYCTACRCIGPHNMDRQTAEQAAVAWNTRVPA